MGSRAAIAVIDGGVVKKYYTHWGGSSLHLDLLPGPVAAVRFATAQKAIENWVADLEAGAVIDLDNHVLLWFSLTCRESAVRAGVFETMSDTWPHPWSVRWADSREHDLYEYCDGRRSECAITVHAGGGSRSRVYTSPLSAEDLLQHGPALLEEISGWEPAQRISTLPRSVIALGAVEKKGTIWALQEHVPDFEAIVAERWPGWSWKYVDSTVPAHEPAPAAAEPASAAAFADLAEDFEQHQRVDAGTQQAAVLLAAVGWIHSLAGRGSTGAKVVQDNTTTHHPVELSAAELDATRAAIAAAALRAAPG